MQEQHSWMDVERRSGTYEFGREEGRAEGREEGRAEGRAEGRDEGREEGRRLALRELIVGSLDERGLALDEQSTARIQACEDLPTLQQWARRAMLVASVEQLFE